MNVGLKIARTGGYFFLFAAKWVGCLEFADSSCGFLSGCKRGLFTERVETKGYMLARHLKSSTTAGGDLLDQLAEKRCLISFFLFFSLSFLFSSHFSPIPGPYYHIHRFNPSRLGRFLSSSPSRSSRTVQLIRGRNLDLRRGSSRVFARRGKLLSTFESRGEHVQRENVNQQRGNVTGRIRAHTDQIRTFSLTIAAFRRNLIRSQLDSSATRTLLEHVFHDDS